MNPQTIDWKSLVANNSLPIQSHAPFYFRAQHRWSLDLFSGFLGRAIRHIWLLNVFIIVYLWQYRQLSLPLFTASPTFIHNWLICRWLSFRCIRQWKKSRLTHSHALTNCPKLICNLS